MTAQELRRVLKRLKLSQSAFARRIHVNTRTVRRWVAGEAPTPEAVVLLLQAWLKRK
ncbi:MAG TPA: helix-turn-helix domain-containing protein [bacterium]|nr:helix-turn-helix domain-containing protein [bacterium]